MPVCIGEIGKDAHSERTVVLSGSQKLGRLHLSSNRKRAYPQEHPSSLAVGSFELVGPQKSMNQKMENWLKGARSTTPQGNVGWASDLENTPLTSTAQKVTLTPYPPTSHHVGTLF